MAIRSRHAPLAGAVVLVLSLAGQAILADSITKATLTPEKPTTDAPVRVVLVGEFDVNCPRSITPVVEEKVSPEGSEFLITLVVKQLPLRVPCLNVVTPFSVDVGLGFPRAYVPYTVSAVLDEEGNLGAFPDLARFQVALGDERGITGITTVPENPTAADPITLRVHGLVIACIVNVVGSRAEFDSSGKRIVAVVRLEIPPALCPGRPIQFDADMDLGPLPTGSYAVDVALSVTGDYSGPTEFPAVGSIEVAPPPGPPRFLRADANGDGAVDISDPVFTLIGLFAGGPVSPCADAADANDSGVVDISDAVFTLEFLFLEGKGPPDPGPEAPGLDPSADQIDCERGI